jgi:hypothetical protein
MEFVLLFILLSVMGLILLIVSPFIKHNLSGKLWVSLSLSHFVIVVVSFGDIDMTWSLYSLLGVFLLFGMGMFLTKGMLPFAFVNSMFLILWNSVPLISGKLGLIILFAGSLWTIIHRKRYGIRIV